MVMPRTKLHTSAGPYTNGASVGRNASRIASLPVTYMCTCQPYCGSVSSGSRMAGSPYVIISKQPPGVSTLHRAASSIQQQVMIG